MNSRLNDRCVEMHTASANAGWWPDEVTPELIATKLMLVVTELSEAHDGFVSGEKDQHLPHLDSFAVELADARIRIFDLCGKLELPIAWYVERIRQAYEGELTVGDDGQPLPSVVDEVQLIDVVGHISHAMEGLRKENSARVAYGLAGALYHIDVIAETYRYDIEDITDQKRDYNAQRADHKPEARAAAGGKKL